MSLKTLQSKVLKTESIAWQSLQFIQQEDFKDLSPEAMQKLKDSIQANHFLQPFYVWQEPGFDTVYKRDIVLDFFLGSGTCLMAAEKTNRYCYATEISPKYVQSAINRYVNYCKGQGIEVTFSHDNGSLTLNDLMYATEPTTA